MESTGGSAVFSDEEAGGEAGFSEVALPRAKKKKRRVARPAMAPAMSKTLRCRGGVPELRWGYLSDI
jgi:hypothetical protein